MKQTNTDLESHIKKPTIHKKNRDQSDIYHKKKTPFEVYLSCLALLIAHL